MNILVVDDLPTNRLLLKYMVESEGHSVVEAEDGKCAVELVKEDKFDLVFMDMMMPVMNGYVATKHIKDMYPDLPVYVVSAYKKEDFPADWQSVDYEDILAKPVSVGTIADILHKHNV